MGPSGVVRKQYTRGPGLTTAQDRTTYPESMTVLGRPLELPCGVRLKNRLVKSAMSDSLGDGEGNPTEAQMRLYERWAEGGAALSLIGEAQVDPRYPEKPGNLELPGIYARAAILAKSAGFGGVQIHAAHGFLLSQFLSPLFNRRTDAYGGSIERRFRIIHDVIDAVRRTVGVSFPIGIKINSTDNLAGGLAEDDALQVVRMLDRTSVDLIDVSGGTYFPGAASSTDGTSSAGPYFTDFAERAKEATSIPIMATGGFETRDQARAAVEKECVDAVSLARAMALNPRLANTWLSDDGGDPEFPAFDLPPRGGVTAWYTMRLTALGKDEESRFDLSAASALEAYEARDARRCAIWGKRFPQR